MKLEIKIDSDNEAVQEPSEVVDVIERRLDIIRRSLSMTNEGRGSLFDINGNVVGYWEFKQ